MIMGHSEIMFLSSGGIKDENIKAVMSVFDRVMVDRDFDGIETGSISFTTDGLADILKLSFRFGTTRYGKAAQRKAIQAISKMLEMHQGSTKTNLFSIVDTVIEVTDNMVRELAILSANGEQDTIDSIVSFARSLNKDSDRPT